MAGAPTTYAELKTALLDADAIPSASDYADNADLFIDLAEARFNSTLRTRDQLATSTLSMDDDGEASLPSDYLALQRATAIEGTRRVPLIEVSPEWMDDQHPVAYGGIGQHVTVDGPTVRVRPITGTVEWRYYAAVPALSANNVSNWLLSAHPGLYLAAALYESAIWYDDETAQQRYAAKLADQMAQVTERDKSSRIARRRLGVKGPTP